MKNLPTAAFVVVALVQVCAGATITVEQDGSGDYIVIQDALDAAADGDTILIGPGEFLDNQWVRIPGYSWDVRVYGMVQADDLTIIGAGNDQTIVGPLFYQGSSATFSPKCFVYLGDGDLHMQDLQIRYCYDGIHSIYNRLFIDDCRFYDLRIGITWLTDRAGGWIKNCEFTFLTPSNPIGFDISGTGSDIVVEYCHFDNAAPIVRSIQNFQVLDCVFENAATGFEVYNTAHAILRNCRTTNISSSGVSMSFTGAICEIYDSEISGDLNVLFTGRDGRYIVDNSRLVGGEIALLRAIQSPGPCEIHNSDFIKGSGPVVLCENHEMFPSVVHDLTDNFWGTTSAAEIEDWIIDSNDDPNIKATVLYSPFAGEPLPAESTSWGDLKALFR